MPTTTNRKRIRPGVRPGQVWQDADPRFPHRYLQVVTVDARADEAVVQPAYQPAGCPSFTRPGPARRRLRLDRFKDTPRGYRLIRDAA